MASLCLTTSSLRSLKNSLRIEFSGTSSSHRTEAIAAALGFRSHAALLAHQHAVQADPPFIVLNARRFIDRLSELSGLGHDPDFAFERLDLASAGLVDTRPWTAYLTDAPVGAKAYRNLMVLAVNEGLRQKLYSLRPGDNRWLSTDEGGASFQFALPSGEPVLGRVKDAGRGELEVSAAVNPHSGRAWPFGSDLGDAVAMGVVERQAGAWLQPGIDFSCTHALSPVLGAIEVAPMGYGDCGRQVRG
ncbi:MULTISPECIES: hypothetical protein [unclassified Variovorax]|uniref:hypothetical protein n=1 Tax=unclassified Variovorax TaxID=663243 RepID=UPI0008393933|nr:MULTISPECIES: hypothetical protein [unclassified Variovorax]PNG50325.1 hypothetical protein CHC06_05948 [Variovorax sp. B2]PNG51198.1 hypothetical protein CHC07_05854 [Variovorax sp. B4]VTV17421.1 hypothetical protein WDL1P1_00375 [Variovorax sp. WDL1]